MAIREILGFHHIPNVSTTSAAAFTKALGNLPLLYRGNTGNTKSFIFGGPANPVLTCGITSSAVAAYWILDVPKMVKNTPIASIVGMRISFPALATPAAGNASIACSIAALAWTGNDTNRLPVFTLQDFLAEGEDYTVLQGQERYLELKFNWATGVVERRVDGVALTPLNVAPSVVLTAFQSRAIGVFMVAGSAASAQWGWKDIYWIDDTQDDTHCDFLGPQIVIPATLNVEESTGWTSTSGTVNAALNTALNTTTPDTPSVSSPDSASPLIAALSAVDSRVSKVSGVTVSPAMFRPAGTFVAADFKFTAGGNSTPSQRLAPGTTIVHNLRGPIFEKAPDGGEWTLNKVNASKLNLTPAV